MLTADSLPEPSSDSIEWLLVSSVSSDHRVNTRPVDTYWVDKKVRDGFDPDRLGVPIVSHRADGTYVWLDGQHRGELIRRAGWSDQKVQCRVFTGLTLAEEAKLFLGHNDNRQVKPLYTFLAKVTAGDPTARAIAQIVESHGWVVKEKSGGHAVSAVASLHRVYESDRKVDGGPGRVLDITLRTVTEAWGYRPEAVDGRILAGVGALVLRFSDQIDRAALVKKLAEYPGGPSRVIGDARGLNQYQHGTVASCLGEVVHSAYNARRRKNVLPDWR